MRLKSLTLHGFKSFADKTTLTFHEGITCIVGPNGCGKSNIVDAFKWVMGEQSAKSLRGGEMMDVIFNGTPTRRSAGYAEVSLAFEDFSGFLGRSPDQEGLTLEGEKPAAATAQYSSGDSVTITRRLYRNGESEYLINNKAARLKDIREMFLDTGAGVDAYSLIEQGRVEVFLQASPADRRALFDEAAGISKYKARKKEAIRRLERVDQNLLRAADILEEVEKRLRSIKVQAGKARNYQQYSTRLTELRSLFSLAEYYRLGKSRRDLQEQVGKLTDQLAGLNSQIDQLEAARSATEVEMADLERTARQLDSQIAGISGQIETCQQRSDMLSVRAKELADSAASDSAKCEQLEARLESSNREAVSVGETLSGLDRELVQLNERDQAARDSQAAAAQAVQQIRAQLEDEKNGTIELLRRTAQLNNEINSQTMRRENLSSQRQRLQGRSGEIAQQMEALLTRRAGITTKLDEINALLADSQKQMEATQQQARQMQSDEHQTAEELSRMQQAHSALLSRQSVLSEMQRKLEGIGTGVRKVLTAAREGKLPSCRGMLGEFIETDVEHAKLIESALLRYEQHLVMERFDDLASAAATVKELLGNSDGAEFICLDRVGAGKTLSATPIPADAAVLARASDWARCDASLTPAVEAILGRTLIVNTLSDAARIASACPDGWRFVTTSSEVLEAEGHVRIGTGKSSTGVISRRSELADLDRRLEESQHRIEELKARRAQLQADRAHLEQVVGSLRTALYEANSQRIENQSSLKQVDERMGQLRKEAPLLDQEVGQLAQEIELAVRREHEAQQKAQELESLRTQRESRTAELQAQYTQAVQHQDSLNNEITAARVALAEARQKQRTLQESLQRLGRTADAITQELAALRNQIEQARQRKAEAEQGAAEARQQIGALLQQKGELAREAAETAESAKGLDQRLHEIRECVAAQRKVHDDMAGQANNLKVQLSEVEVRIEGLITRTAEELNLDLPASYEQYSHDETRDWEGVRLEIADLRGKIERLGNVNLDAIAEQEELQQRETFLSGQLEDIRSSHRHLNELIKRINVESQRRFEEAFQAVRANFNELFRKLFGGGKADVLLVNPEDALESDIDVIARPPGKETKSISLLSGGEKTMTALALLFSFFKARPSPFCLLDEVDAALDEANVGRFTQLVVEFLTTSQFVVVSHSKRTMSMANNIYGITMQEPGVSSPISVRFEEAQTMVATEAVSA